LLADFDLGKDVREGRLSEKRELKIPEGELNCLKA